jgi:hypothetical protein
METRLGVRIIAQLGFSSRRSSGRDPVGPRAVELGVEEAVGPSAPFETVSGVEPRSTPTESV